MKFIIVFLILTIVLMLWRSAKRSRAIEVAHSQRVNATRLQERREYNTSLMALSQLMLTIAQIEYEVLQPDDLSAPTTRVWGDLVFTLDQRGVTMASGKVRGVEYKAYFTSDFITNHWIHLEYHSPLAVGRKSFRINLLEMSNDEYRAWALKQIRDLFVFKRNAQSVRRP